MPITAAKLQVEIGGNTQGAEDGIKRVQQGLHQLGSAGQVALGTVLGNAITGAGRQLMGLGEQALNSYGEFERLGMSLQQLSAKELLNTGGATSMAQALELSAGKAKDLQGWVQKLAVESPFTQDGVAKAFRMAMAYGFTTNEAKRLTQAMIDFASGTGATDQTMERIALALGQIQAKGKLAGQEVLQLTQAGLNVDQILAEAFGKSTAEIVKMREAGLIPADQAIQAIVKSLEQDFGGAAKRQSGSISGLVSSLSDLKDVGLREAFGALFREFQPDVQHLVDTLQDPKTVEMIRGWGEEFAKTARQFVTSAGEIYTWFTNLEQGTQGAVIGLGLLALNAGTAVKVMTGLYTVVSGLPAVAGAVTTAWGAWNSGLTLTSALGTMLSPMAITLGAIALAAGSVVAIWIAWNEQIVKTNNEGNKGVQGTFGSFFTKLIADGADATKVTEEFVSAFARMNNEIDKAGFAGVFVNRTQLAQSSIKEFNYALLQTSTSYDDYKAHIMDAMEQTGILGDNVNMATAEMYGFGVANDEAARGLGMLTEEEYRLRTSSSALKDATYELGYADEFASDQGRAMADIVREQGQAAEDLSEKLKGLNDDLKTIVSGQFGEENESFLKQQEDIRSEIEQTQAKIDELSAKPYLSQAQKGDLEDAKTKLGELQDKLKETADAHEEAMRRMAFNMLQERASSDGLTQNEVTNLTSIAKAWGLYDQTTADMVNAVNQNLGDLDTADPSQLLGILEGIMALPTEKEFTVTTKYEFTGMAPPPGDGKGATSRAGADADIAESITSSAELGIGALDRLYGKAEETKSSFRDVAPIQSFKTEVGTIYEVFPQLDKTVESSTKLIQTFKDIWDAIDSKDISLHVEIDNPNPSAGSGTPTCFVAGTPVNTPDGFRPIEQIREGDAVITLTRRGPVVSHVLQLSGSLRDDLVQVTISDGQAFTCSPNHRFMTLDQGWVVAEKLVRGQPLRAIDGPVFVVSVVPVTGKLRVYNFAVDHPSHTYLVGGVMVHNKKPDEARASGGLASSGDPYLVGEEGPEMFIPRATGTVVNAQQTNQLAAMLNQFLNGGFSNQPAAQPIIIQILEANDPRRSARMTAAEIARIQR